ncbi:hypothetical protein L596_005172 [Steinernema carpocapsae]|uniref:Uncharacterized protein n=1 Tax=Steinernema carpocapsae TaxID=34508 RepID=A0A4U8V2D8_STECR|nr:hypothetical protein L596_005172 [Steinernema carpocapsae]
MDTRSLNGRTIEKKTEMVWSKHMLNGSCLGFDDGNKQTISGVPKSGGRGTNYFRTARTSFVLRPTSSSCCFKCKGFSYERWPNPSKPNVMISKPNDFFKFTISVS